MKRLIKSILEKILYTFKSTKYNELYNIINEYQYISFDIFDTLIKRNVKNPTDIFDIVEKKYNGKLDQFKEKRMKAEKIARQKSKYEEVTLKEIYQELNYSKKLKDTLYNLEIEIEKNFCVVNKEMLEFYNYCLQNNKTILLASDMYLPKEVIESILVKNGYRNYSKIYLSSEERLTKHSGSLFKKIIEEQKISNQDFIHIGDSIVGDYLSLKKMNIKSVLIKREVNNTLFNIKKSKSLDYNILSSFINNNIDYKADDYTKFGYEVLGPILYSFTTWIHEKVKEDKIDKIYFLARDAKIIKELYQERFKMQLPVYYLNVSRKSIIMATLKNVKSFDELVIKYKSIIKETSNVIDLLNTTNVDYKKYSNELTNLLNKQLSILTMNEKGKIFTLIKEDLAKNHLEQYEYLQKYLKQNNFYNKVALVDIGWNGTIQYLLNDIISDKTEIFGYYYGVNKDRKYQDYTQNIRHGCLFNASNLSEEQIIVCLGIGLFEMMFLSLEGTTIGYKKNNNLIEPVLDEKSNVKDISLISKLQKGAKQFSRDLEKSSICKFIYDMPNNIWFENYKNIVIKPSIKVINLFANVEFQNFNRTKLINNKSLIYYLFHPKQFYSDFMNSYCKTLFMKNIFKLKLPYYSILKRLYIKQKDTN